MNSLVIRDDLSVLAAPDGVKVGLDVLFMVEVERDYLSMLHVTTTISCFCH